MPRSIEKEVSPRGFTITELTIGKNGYVEQYENISVFISGSNGEKPVEVLRTKEVMIPHIKTNVVGCICPRV
jgi:hypothetical protein